MWFSKKSLSVFKRYYKDEKMTIHTVEEVSKLYDMRPKGKYTIDDQCMYDLDMENVFYNLDRTYSSTGEATLYKMLREPVFDEKELKQRDKIIRNISENNDLRAKLQYVYHDLGFDKKNRFLDMMEKDLEGNKLKSVLYTLFGIVNLLLIILAFLTFNKYIAFAVLVLFICAPVIVNYEGKKVCTNGLIYLNGIISTADRVVSFDRGNLLDTAKINKLLKEVKFIKTNTRLINLAAIYGGILEPFLIPFLILEGSYYRVCGKVKDKREDLLELYYELGKIEAYISIAIYKEINEDSISTPKFIENSSLKIKDGIHPLLEEPVANSITINKKGVVLTGTNMSGKSTFLRMIGINSILSQSFYFTLTKEYEAPFLNVVTSISPQDDVNTGKSYYLAEAEAILRIIKAQENQITSLCIIDEIFRGTNPVERIAASSAILNYIDKRNAITFVATHDQELTEKLKGNYDFYYFSEDVDHINGLSFDYKIKSGVVKTRNAIKLLDYMGYPQEIIKEAVEFDHME